MRIMSDVRKCEKNSQPEDKNTVLYPGAGPRPWRVQECVKCGEHFPLSLGFL